MKRLFVLAILLALTSACGADYLGSWKINDYVPLHISTHRLSTGQVYQPTSLTYSIYEDGGTTGIDEDVDMTPASPFDGVTGLYLSRRQLTAAAGFEAGKNYLVVIKATVDGVSQIKTHSFQVQACVTATTNSDKTAYELAASQHVIVDSGTVTTLTNLPAVTTDWLTAAGVQADAVTKIQNGLATPTNITAAAGVALAADQAVNLTKINGTAIPGTGTRVADGFVALLNVASPVFTLASVNQTGDAYTPALAAQTAAEKIDTANELRTLLTGATTALALKADLPTDFSGVTVTKNKIDANATVSIDADDIEAIVDGLAAAGMATATALADVKTYVLKIYGGWVSQ
jgi:hypothetical protein